MKRQRFFLIVVLCFLFSSSSFSFPYKSVEESYSKGLKWGGKKSIKKMKKVFDLWYPVFWDYGGGRDPVWLSFLALTETAHTANPFASTKDTQLGECGLLSVKRTIAKKYDVDCCNVKANVWAKCKYRYDKNKWIDEKYSNKKFYQRMDYADRFLMYAMYGKSSCFRIQSKAIATAMTAKKYQFTSPYMVALDWIKLKGNSLQEPQWNYCWGKNDAIVNVFRFVRAKAMRDLLIKIYGGGKKGRKRWANCVRPVKNLNKVPKNSGYPGDKLHGQCCDNWQASSKGKSCWEKWNKPTSFKYKGKGKKKKYMWSKLCPDKSCTFENVFDLWKKEKQDEGVLPSEDDYKRVKQEMINADCWILD